MLLIIDNYDSFTYNLYQIAGLFTADIKVVLNDKFTVKEIEEMDPSHIIISPGPGRPEDAGICEEVILAFQRKVPLLGICLGHQAICQAYGSVVTYAKELVHGKRCAVHIANGNPIFRHLPPMLEAGRYHSLAVDRSTIPDELLVIAETDDGEVMGVKHRSYDVFGLQFHPESILTKGGEKIIENFLKIGGGLQ
ncbi:anthranilate synthase component 2 [Candidatus Methanoplasma termitum]|uniref:anthranilate synthase n=1 Tax=Candidatus Methanoplasma termitum TaxID=1577791 RepID=A0A0A7L9X5_9ARCH|nr:aminodeoxychorismate/anthranilate synthase component II [Candidatus Methanoplasma termitum]AIZ55955.1 anthranilate synthase component 2 [Candidatus Methanoplasma termitum]MCL2334273.1 aminodeoxychorismate/anthranilate synthase component II [Candidatus Methanoplasma sp.]